MPLYDYQCKQCQKVTEVRHGFKDVHADVCPHCGGPLSRVFNPAGIVFKGSGFYITDSRKNTGGGGSDGATTAPSSTPAPAAAAAPAASETKKSDAA